jgi:hypothetical protein
LDCRDRDHCHTIRDIHRDRRTAAVLTVPQRRTATVFRRTSTSFSPNHHAESILSFDIWGPLELDLTFIFDRVEKPVENADGDVPKSNDFRITMGLGVSTSSCGRA